MNSRWRWVIKQLKLHIAFSSRFFLALRPPELEPLLLLVKLNKLFLLPSAEVQLDVEADGELKREEDEGSIARPGRQAVRSDSGLPDCSRGRLRRRLRPSRHCTAWASKSLTREISLFSDMIGHRTSTGPGQRSNIRSNIREKPHVMIVTIKSIQNE